ncbi:MAG: hypothetical protein Q4P72_04425 [Eubacteriales bacterium]|nr:hypothetical protein [Eubacteriales bacterium]
MSANLHAKEVLAALPTLRSQLRSSSELQPLRSDGTTSTKKRLDAILDEIRRKHPFPHEIKLRVREEQVDALLNRIMTVPADDLEALARSLSSDELDALLLAFDSQLSNAEFDRVWEIAKMRSTPNLHRRALHLFEKIFPNLDLLALLADQAELLTVAGPEAAESLGFPREDDLANFAVFSAGSRRFLESISKQAQQEIRSGHRKKLQDFIKYYHLNPSSPLVHDFFALYFMNCETELLIRDMDICIALLRILPDPVVAALTTRILDETELPEDNKLDLYTVIEDECLFNSERDLMSQLTSASQSQIMHWSIRRRLAEHASEQSLKYQFLDSNLDVCQGIADLDHEILALEFRNFVLISDRHDPLHLSYYQKKYFDEMYWKVDRPLELAHPHKRVPKSSEVVEEFEPAPLVDVDLEGAELESARRFYDYVCSKRQSFNDLPKGILKDY